MDPLVAGGGCAVEATHLVVRYSGHPNPVLAIPELAVSLGDFVSIVGRSGSGKTTLLRTFAGFITPCQGTVRVLGGDPSGDSVRQRLGVLHQDPGLVPWLSVVDNVLLPLRLRGAALRREPALNLLDGLGLAASVSRYPDQLSGGMRTRVAIARALVTEPELLLMDEPLGSLDEPTRADVSIVLRNLSLARGVTVLMVTHNITDALRVSDRLIVLRTLVNGTNLSIADDLAIRDPVGSASRDIEGEYRRAIAAIEGD